MTKLYLFLFMLLPLSQAAQEYALFDTSTIDNRSKLLGIYRTPQPYERMDFIIDNPDDIKALIPTLTAGTEVYPQLPRDFFVITLLQEGKEMKAWTVDMKRNCLLIDGRAYLFDAAIVKKLARENPFRLKMVTKTFTSQEEADQYLEKQKLDRSFLYARMPTIDYEGYFEVRIPRSGIQPQTSSIQDTVRNTLARMAPPGSFDVIYVNNRAVAADKRHYTCTIYGKKETYDRLNIAGWVKGKWARSAARATLFYRKY